MAQIETWLNQEMTEAVKVRYLDGNLFSMDNAGNLIGVNLTKNGVAYSGGGTVSASVIRADGGTVAVTGALSGNVATVVLPQAAYAVPGVVSIVVKLTVSGEITTIAAVVANVYESTTSSTVDPGTLIPSIETLIAAINAAVASIPADYSSLWTSLAPAFSSSTAYTAGQYVTYNGVVERFIVDHPAGAWNASHVVATNLGSELSSLKSAITLDSYENIASDIGTFERAGVSSGHIGTATNRVSSTNLVKVSPLFIFADTGYKFFVHYLTSADIYTNVSSGWQTEYNILQQYECFRICIAKNDNSDFDATTGVADALSHVHIVSMIGDSENTVFDNITTVFGAVGDGTTDDTTALQNALNYCADKNIPFRAGCGKQYKITSKLSISKAVDCDWNWSTLKTSSSIGSVIEIDVDNNSEAIGHWYGQIKNLIIDAPTANCGLYLKYGRKWKVSNIRFENVKTVAVQIDGGYENVFNDIHINGVATGTAYNAHGIEVYTGDCHFTDIMIINCKVAIIATLGATYFTRVHAWASETSAIANSIYAKIAGICFFTDCYVDTFQYGFNIINDVAVTINGCMAMYNSLYDQTFITGHSLPYLFHYGYIPNDSGSYSVTEDASKYTVISNSIIRWKSTFDKMYFSNLTQKKTYVNAVTNSNIFDYVDKIPTAVMEMYPANSNKFTKEFATLYVRNSVAMLDFAMKCVGVSVNTQYDLFDIPEKGLPGHNLILSCQIVSNVYGTEVLGEAYIYLSKTTKKATIKLPVISESDFYIRGTLTWMAS